MVYMSFVSILMAVMTMQGVINCGNMGYVFLSHADRLGAEVKAVSDSSTLRNINVEPRKFYTDVTQIGCPGWVLRLQRQSVQNFLVWNYPLGLKILFLFVH